MLLSLPHLGFLVAATAASLSCRSCDEFLLLPVSTHLVFFSFLFFTYFGHLVVVLWSSVPWGLRSVHSLLEMVYGMIFFREIFFSVIKWKLNILKGIIYRKCAEGIWSVWNVPSYLLWGFLQHFLIRKPQSIEEVCQLSHILNSILSPKLEIVW